MKVAVAVLALVALMGAASAQATNFPTPQAALDSTTDNPNAPCLDMFKSLVLNNPNISEALANLTGQKMTVFVPSDAAFEAAGLNASTVQTLATTEEGAKILAYHMVSGAGLSSDRIKTLPEVNSAKGRSMATSLCEGAAAGCPNVVVVKAGAPTGNTRKMLQVVASPSPSPALAAGAVQTVDALAAPAGVVAAEVSPSPVVAAAVEASPAVDAAAVTASPAVDAAAVGASPAVDAAAVGASPAVDAAAVGASPAVDAAAVGASPAVDAAAVTASPAVDAAAVGASPAEDAAAVGASPAVDAAAVALPGGESPAPLDTGAAAATAVDAGVSPEVTKTCAPGTPSGITVNDGLKNTPANVVFPDLRSGEVFFHVIDRVLLPPGTTIAQVTKAIADADAAAAALAPALLLAML